MPVLLRTLFVLLPTLALLGCGESTDSDPRADADSSAPNSSSQAVKQVAARELPKLGDYLPPLDDGRVEVAPPADWHRMPKMAAYLCSFTEAKGGRLPALVVKVSEPTVEGFENVTEENVADFAAAVQETLKEPLESAVPLVLGSNSFARYVKAARVKNVAAEVQVLATIQNGRMYTVELQVIAKAILAHRDHGYAVGAGMKFKDEPADDTPEPAKSEEAVTEPPSVETPAAEEPAATGGE